MANRRSRKNTSDNMVPKLILLVAAVLILFEGRLVLTMISQKTSVSVTTQKDAETEAAPETEAVDNIQDTEDRPAAQSSSSRSASATLAGLPSLYGGSDTGSSEAAGDSGQTAGGPLPTVSNPDSAAIVREAASAVDDSYFSDAVFIGDSRMEGFRNVSGITQGQFFTSVGMSLSGLISEPIITVGDTSVTVAAAVSGGTYRKIYLMLGTNDLGEYDLEGFHDRFTSAAQRLQELQPDAILYICSIIYVDEAKVTTGDYVNNTNVDKLNAILLQICEEQGYYYIDLNEILSNGNGSLIEDASSDGVHLQTQYCQQMLQYLKTHYVTAETSGSSDEAETETESEGSV